MNTIYKSFAVTFLFIGAVGLATFSHAEEYNLSYGARLTEANGAPILGQDGKLDLEVSFYSVGTGGSPIGPSPISFLGTSIAEGVFQVGITLTPAEFHQVFQDPSTPVYIEVKDVKNGAVFPRQRFSVIPFALKTPIDNDTIVYNSDGKLTVGSSVGTVKQVTAGSGLTGGSITDSGTITVDAGTTGNKIVQLSDGKLPSVDGSNLLSVNAEKLQTRSVSAAVPVSGQVLKWSGSAWVPSSDLVGETGSGEANTASNVTSASGVGLFKGKVSADLMFYSLSPGAGVTINLVDDDVVIASTITQYTDAMAKAAAVVDSIADSVTTIAPSQNAVFDALATKQASVTTSTDLNLNSVTTNAVNAITVNPGVSTGEIKLKELSVNGANYVGLKAPGSITSDLTFTLPGVAGTNGQFLKTDGSGNLSWTDQASAPVSSVNTLTGAVTLTTTNVTEGANLYYTDARAKSAAVGDAITDAVTDKAPSQNAVFDALALKSAASHNHDTIYEPKGLSTDVVTNAKMADNSVGSAEIIDLSIGTGDIATAAITTAKIAACADTQILKMSGVNWICSSDANSGGTVTNVTSGTGLTGGPITGTGTLSLATSGVTAGTYTKVTVDTYGRATSGTSIAAGDLPSSIDAAKIGSGGVNSTEFGYLDGVTSAIQTQLNGQVVGPASATDNAIARFDGTTGKLMQNSGVVIDDSGNVGIGTVSPQSSLDVNGGAAFRGVNYTSGGNAVEINFTGSGWGQIASVFGQTRAVQPLGLWGNPISFYTSGGVAENRLTITGTGNVGIGTTSPTERLHVISSQAGGGIRVEGTGTNTPAVSFTNNGVYEGSLGVATTANHILTGTSVNDSAWRSQGNLLIGTGGDVVKMTINTSGNVGIGTTNPTTVLNIINSAGGRPNGLQFGKDYIYNIYQGSNALVIDSNGDTDYRQSVGTNNGTGNLIFMTGAGSSIGGTGSSVERMRINAFGNVGIGTVSPTQKLTVAGTVESTSGGIKYPDGTIQTSTTLSTTVVSTFAANGAAAFFAATCPADYVRTGCTTDCQGATSYATQPTANGCQSLCNSAVNGRVYAICLKIQ